jgi:site-specific recombinase XerD
MRSPVTFHAGNAPSNIYLDSYKDWLNNQSVTANTLRAYHSRIKQFLLFLGYANLSDNAHSDLTVMNEAMRLYLDFLKDSKKSDKSTINANVNALNNFSSFLGIKETQLPREQTSVKPAKILTLDEQERFLRSVEKQTSARDKALSLVLFYVGLRIGDCARLNIDDVASGATSIRLNDEIRVTLNEQTVVALKQWLEERKTLVGASEESALWVTNKGQRLTISGIAFVVKRIGWQARLTVSTEMLRRTWLTKATDSLSKAELASRFGGYVSAAAIRRHGLLSHGESSLEH